MRKKLNVWAQNTDAQKQLFFVSAETSGWSILDACVRGIVNRKGWRWGETSMKRLSSFRLGLICSRGWLAHTLRQSVSLEQDWSFFES